MYTSSYPATAANATGVGAVSNTKFPVLLPFGSYTTANSTSANFSIIVGAPVFASAVKLPVWSAVDSNNACTPLPNGTDLSKTLVLVQYLDAKATGCYPQDQGSNVVAAGGRYMLYYEASGSNLYVLSHMADQRRLTNIYRTMRDELYVYSEGLEGVAKVPPYVAQQWLSMLEQNLTVTASIPATENATIHYAELENNETGGLMANTFTSWGPSWELDIKPNVAAPGENILSTYLTSAGSYRVMSGTSMGKNGAHPANFDANDTPSCAPLGLGFCTAQGSPRVY